MSEVQEFDHQPVPPQRLHRARHFAALYAGEHIAGTEFVIGAAFVAWGVAAIDVIFGLLLGNTLAVLTWRFVCAPIAVDTRMTLYAYLEKITGKFFIFIYSIVNGILFAILAGSMITVSASAVRIPFGIEPQTHWYPTDIAFVLVALGVGAVVVTVAVYGFKRLAQFAQAVVPWMIVMFLVGALTLLPVLSRNAGLSMPIASLNELWLIAKGQVWLGNEAGLSFWHVTAFAWVCNLAMHGSLGDMTILRYARKASYGYFSALGMFIGHFAAWIFAGVMGAGAGVILSKTIIQLDAGEVAYQALGVSGIIAVIIAGWTTSNPTLYRAGLAFQSLNPKWSRAWVTAIVGVITTIIACFPFVFTKLLSFVGLMGLTLAPVGAILVTEHWLFPKMGLTRYWREYTRTALNWPALASWIIGLLCAWLLNSIGLHLFFLLIPVWVITTVVYIVLARIAGAASDYGEYAIATEQQLFDRKQAERAYLQSSDAELEQNKPQTSLRLKLANAISILALAVCVALGIYTLTLDAQQFDAGLQQVRSWLIWPTLVFFIVAIISSWWRAQEE